MSRIAIAQKTTRRVRLGCGRPMISVTPRIPSVADGNHLQNAEDVVDGRVVGSLLVSIVEAMHARDEHPEREARHEEGDLPTQC